MTADRLTRTARWLEKLEGGIEYLRKVVVDDHLGIGKDLDAHMEQLIDTYQCEWTTVVRDKDRRKQFGEFVNTTEKDGPLIEMKSERGQQIPVEWPKEVPPLPTVDVVAPDSTSDDLKMSWVSVGSTDLFPIDEGRVVRIGKAQIAVFHLADQWYATQNMCPHKRALVLASGILGMTEQKRRYVSCPMHKKNFDIKTGACLVAGEEDKYRLSTFEVKIGDDNEVYLFLPPVGILDRALGTAQTIVTQRLANGATEPTVLTFEEAPACGPGVASGCGDKSLDW